MKKNDVKMSWVGHLSEIRKRLIFCLILTFACFVLFFFMYDPLLDFLVLPLTKINGIKLVTMSVAENFLVNVRVAISFAMLVNFPVYAIQAYLFLLPAFNFNNKATLVAFLSFVLMFTLGAGCFYFVIFPEALNFFVNYGAGQKYIESNIRLSDYISFVLYCAIGFGLVFQMPLLLIFLGKYNVISAEGMRRFRKFAIPTIFFIAAIVTPPDIMSQVVLGSIMILFYEVTIIIVSAMSKKTEKRSLKKQKHG